MPMTYNRISVNILISLEKLILKLIWNLKQPQIAKTILKQNEARILTHFKNLLFCDPMDCSLTGSSVHGIFQKRTLEWVAIHFTRGSSRPRDRTQVSCIGGRFFTVWATSSVQSLSRVRLFATLMNRSTPGLSVHHQRPEFTQTHVHRVSDAIQLSHPLLSPSLPALHHSQHQSLFPWVNSSHEVAKVLEFQL